MQHGKSENPLDYYKEKPPNGSWTPKPKEKPDQLEQVKRDSGKGEFNRKPDISEHLKKTFRHLAKSLVLDK